MIAVNLKINENAYDKVMYLLKSLPRDDVKISYEEQIEEIELKKLSQDNFDYIAPEQLKKIDEMVQEAKEENFKNLKSFDELKNEI